MQPVFDAAWRKAALGGDGAAVDRLAEWAIEPLYRFCLYRVGGNRHHCEEVVQETMLRAIRELSLYEPERAGGRIFGWLTGIARNEIRRVHARERRGRSLETLWNRVDRELTTALSRLERERIAEDVILREETGAIVNAALSQLPPHYQAALEAKYVDGRSVREIAAADRVTEKTIESRLARARDAFRTAFTAIVGNLEPEPQT